MNPEEREEVLATKLSLIENITLEEARSRVVHMFAFDGKSWEACQHACWLTVDQLILVSLMTMVAKTKDTAAWKAIQHTLRIAALPLGRLVFGTTAMNWICRLTVSGLTFSGHPTRTTVGNSWRM